MACGATLKRNLEFDPLHSPGRSPKRMCMTRDLISPHSKQPHAQTSSSTTSLAEAAHLLANKCDAMLTGSLTSLLHGSCSQSQLSLSKDASPNLSGSPQIAANCMPSLRLSASQTLRQTSTVPNQTIVNSSKEQPLLTLSQVDVICRLMVQEHEDRVREHFDRVLNHKLAEQYESFLKFNHDQLRRRFESQMSDCSYVS